MTPTAKRTLWLAAAVAALVAAVPSLKNWSREHYYHLTASGALGCGAANVTVTSNGVTKTVRTGLDTLRLLGRNLKSDDLVARLEEQLQISPQQINTNNIHKSSRREYEVKLAANLLIQVNDPRAFDLFVRLLDDSIFCSLAVEWLVELGDARAGEQLLSSWRKHQDRPWVYVNAFASLPYEPAAPFIIDVFHMHIGDYDAEALFKTLEIVSGDSLRQFRGRRLDDKQSVMQLKLDLGKWWQNRESRSGA